MTLPAVRHGDMRNALRDLAEAGETFHACVTDPPYHLTSIVERWGNGGPEPKGDVYARASRGFMGKDWDGGDIAMRPDTWRLVWDLLPPGGHLAAFGGTRTFHRMACAIEDAGFELRDTLMWLYGSGFPKSHNQEGEWEGWGTALKPGWEPIVLARKPMRGTVASSLAAHGTGALNIDGCRVPTDDPLGGGAYSPGGRAALPGDDRDGAAAGMFAAGGGRLPGAFEQPEGRWPANVLHDGSDEVEAAFAAFGDRGAAAPVTGAEPSEASVGRVTGERARVPGAFHGDTGSASRFFYCGKAARGDRVFQCEGCQVRWMGKRPCDCAAKVRGHPTVKPQSLMRWLCRLITPPGGRILDPFAGSGSTLAAAHAEGFRALGVEREAEYLGDIQHRLACLPGAAKIEPEQPSKAPAKAAKAARPLPPFDTVGS